MGTAPRFAGGVTALSGPLEQTGGIGVGVASLLVFLFLSYSRATDFWLANLNLPLIASLVALAFTVGTGGLRRAFISRVGFWLSAFSIWLVLAVPFSFWRGGSVDLLWDHWLKSFLVFVIVAGLLRSPKQCRTAMFAVAGGTVIIVLMSLVTGRMSHEGRLVLAQGVLTNSNDLANLLLMGLPFLVLIAMTKGRRWVTRRGAAACIVGGVLFTAATGSRGALVAVACLIGVMVFSLSWGSRIKVLGAALFMAILVLPLLSADQRQRYLTILTEEPEVASANEQSARGSTTQRLYLLRQSLVLTMNYPLFGVGPGQFQAAEAEARGEVGARGTWLESHNAYTQVSSEAGLPALVFYVATLATCLKITRSLYKTAAAQEGLRDIANMSYCLWLSLISFAVTSLFSSVGYHMYLPTLAGLTVALQKSTKLQLASVRSRVAAPSSVPSSAHVPTARVRLRPQLPI